MPRASRADLRDVYYEIVQRLYEWGAWYEFMLTSDNIGYSRVAAGFSEYQSGYREASPVRMPFDELGDDRIDEDRAIQTDQLISLACKDKPHLLWAISRFYSRQDSYRAMAIEYSNYKVPQAHHGASKETVKALDEKRKKLNDYKLMRQWVSEAVIRMDSIDVIRLSASA